MNDDRDDPLLAAAVGAELGDLGRQVLDANPHLSPTPSCPIAAHYLPENRPADWERRFGRHVTGCAYCQHQLKLAKSLTDPERVSGIPPRSRWKAWGLVAVGVALVVLTVVIAWWLVTPTPAPPPPPPQRADWVTLPDPALGLSADNEGDKLLPIADSQGVVQSTNPVNDDIPAADLRVKLTLHNGDLLFTALSNREEVPHRLLGIAFFDQNGGELYRGYALLSKGVERYQTRLLIPAKRLTGCRRYVIGVIPAEHLRVSDAEGIKAGVAAESAVAVVAGPAAALAASGRWLEWAEGNQGRLDPDVRESLRSITEVRP